MSIYAAELGFCHSDLMAYAYEGTDIFAGGEPLKSFNTVAVLYDLPVKIVNAGSECKS